MNGQRQRARGGRRRRRKAKAKTPSTTTPVELIMIAARRPNSPVILGGTARPKVAASAKPRTGNGHASNGARPDGARGNGHIGAAGGAAVAAEQQRVLAAATTSPRRTARIVQLDGKPVGERELERRRLLQRLIESEGRSQISRAAEAYLQAGFAFPEEQEVQLQLLEHFNETRARSAIDALTNLMHREAPKKRPVFEQRLRRLEEYADEVATRQAAANLRRALRT